MNHAATIAATIAAVLLGLCAMIGAHTALKRADQSDRAHAALVERLSEVEGVLTNEQKIALDMVRTKGRK